MVSVCTVPARGGRSCEHFGGYKTINRIPLPFIDAVRQANGYWYKHTNLTQSVSSPMENTRFV